MHLLPRLRLILSLLVVLALMPAPAAFAHAQLLSTSPADSAIVDVAPDAVELIFNEPVNPLTIRLIQPDGTAVELTEKTTGGATTTISLPPELKTGTHVLSWRVVSADGHPIAGSLLFSIGQASGAAGLTTSGNTAVSASLWAMKTLMFVAMFVGIGGAAFSALAPLPSPARTIAVWLTALGILIAPITLGLQGLDALGLALPSFFDGGAWRTALVTSYGATAIAATVAFACSFAALQIPPGKVSVALSLAGATLAALSLAMSGHASAASPQWVTRPAVFLHIAGLLFWIGALLPLCCLLREGSEASSRALVRFSKFIPSAIAPLVVSGLVLAVIQLGSPGPQWLSPYGLILGSKLSLLAVLFGLALWNRHWLTEPALAGDASARQRLRKSIGWELALVAVILALVAGWRFTPPPRALADIPPAVAADPLMEHLIDGNTMSMVTISPGSAGPVSIEILVSDLEHMPKEAMGVTVILSNPELGVEPIHRTASETDGVWRVDDLTIPIAGIWHLETEVRVSRFELARPRGEILIP